MSIPDLGNGTLTAERRAYELFDFMGLPWDDPAIAMYRAAAIRNFKEHARDQRHLCAEAVNGLECDSDNLKATARNQHEEWAGAMRSDAYDAVMNATEPGMHR